MATEKNHVQLSFVDGEDVQIVYPEVKSKDVIMKGESTSDTLESQFNKLGYLAFHNKLSKDSIYNMITTNVNNPPENTLPDATILQNQYDAINLFERNSLVFPPESHESEINDNATTKDTAFSSSKIAVLLKSPYLMSDEDTSEHATWTSKMISDYINKFPKDVTVTIKSDNWVRKDNKWLYDIAFEHLPVTMNCRVAISDSYSIESSMAIREMVYDYDIERIYQEENHIILGSCATAKPDKDFDIEIAFLGNSNY